MIPYAMQPTGPLEQDLWKQGQQLGTGELFRLGVSHTFERETLIGLGMEEERILQAEKKAGTHDPLYGIESDYFDTGSHKYVLSRKEWEASAWYRKNGKGEAAIAYSDSMTPQRAEIYADVYDRRQLEKQLMAQSADTLGKKAVLFGASFVASLPDPINFIPLAGGLGKGASIGKKVVRGAVEGAAGAALTDLIVYPVANARGEDFGFFDAAMDITFGAIIGGGLAGAGGKFTQWREGKVQAEWAAGKQELTKVMQDVGLHPDDAAMYASQMYARLQVMPKGLQRARALRASIGGTERADLGRALEKALLDVADGNPANIGAFHEALTMGRAFDQVGADIEARRAGLVGDEILARITPEDIEGMLVQRGHSIVGDRGEIIVQGRALKRETGTKQNFGLVKIAIKHPEVTKADVMRLPRIVREYEPSATGKDGRREWRVEAGDGSNQRLLISEGRTADGKGTLATMYRITSAEGAPGLSQKRTPAESPQPGFQPETGDTSGGRLDHHTRSQQGNNFPDTSGRNKFTTIAREVNTFAAPEPEKISRAPRLPESIEMELKREGIDMKTGQSLDEVEALRLADEGKIAPEDMAALQSIIDEGQRVSTREDIALSVLGCALGGM